MNTLQEYVYHYTKPDKTQTILEAMTLRMSPLGMVNDPKESSNRVFTFYMRNLANAVSFDPRLFDEMSANLIDQTFALCTSYDIEGDGAGTNQALGALRPNLWAHYGQDHKGVCLVLNRAALHQKILEIAHGHTLFFGPVTYCGHETWGEKTSAAYALYVEDLLSSRDGYINHHIKTFYHELFFLKQQAWRDEFEYRWILRGIIDGSIDIDLTDSLHAVVLGSAVLPDTVKNVVSICKGHNIPVRKMSWRTCGGKHYEFLDESEASKEGSNHVLLDGISFSQNVPSEAVIVLAATLRGEPKPLLIRSNDGTVRFWDGDGNDIEVSKIRANALNVNLVDCGVPQHYAALFSAGRLASVVADPLRVKSVNGTIRPANDEEQPYYGTGFTFPEPPL